LVRGQWRAIVSREDVEQARALVADDTRRPGSANTALLSWIALCGLCGQPLTPIRLTTRSARYACNLMGGKSRAERPYDATSASLGFLDALVVERLHAAVAGGLLHRLAAAEDLYAADDARLADLSERRGACRREYEVGRISRVAWQRQDRWLASCVRSALSDAQDRPTGEELASLAADPEAFPDVWAAMVMRKRRAVLRAGAASISASSLLARNPSMRKIRLMAVRFSRA
jgi:hypothetical protein